MLGTTLYARKTPVARFALRAIAAALLFTLTGCGDGYKPAAMPEGPAAPPAAKTQANAQPAAPAQQSGMTTSMTAMGAAAGMAPLDAMGGPSGVAPASQPKQQPNTVKAQVGVGAHGHNLQANIVSTPIVVPVSAYFASKERLSFNIQIPQAMQLFKASEGRAPKSHQEFMERIIKEQRIPLPELPEGDEYLYDPKTEQLMVKQAPRK